MPPSTRRSLRAKSITIPSTSPTTSTSIENKIKRQSASAFINVVSSSTSASEIEQVSDQSILPSKNRKIVTFSLPESSVTAKEDKIARERLVSARAQRSSRRQSTIEVDCKSSEVSKISHKTTKRGVKRSEKSVKSAKKSSIQKIKKKSNGKDEDVIKVKLNTGTLYLYRGLNRKAVFIRHA